MPKFRKKPIVVEAEQWWPGKMIEGLNYLPSQINEPTIQTLKGIMEISAGDWIITGVEGERYPCRDSIFKKTYEVCELEDY